MYLGIRDVERYWEVKVYLGVGFCVGRVFLGFSTGGNYIWVVRAFLGICGG